MKMKKVSVIMPAYNAEKYIADSIESVLGQTYPNLELIVIDDKSTDSTAEIAAQYASKYPNIKLIVNGKNALVGYSRNIGVLSSTGEYIAFIDADDMYRNDYLEKLVSALEEKQVNIAMCKHRQFIGKKCTSKDNSSGRVKVINVKQNPKFLLKARGYCWNKLYKREIFNRLSFPINITFEDIPFAYPALVLGEDIAFVDEELYHYRRNLSGITITNKKVPQRGVLDLYYASAELGKNYQLVKTDDRLDQTITEIMHSVLSIATLDSSCWVQLSRKDYKRIVNLFAFLANRKYNLTVSTNNCMQEEMHSRLLYFLRLKLVESIVDKDFYTDKIDEEILAEIGEIIDKYSEQASLIDVKQKRNK